MKQPQRLTLDTIYNVLPPSALQDSDVFYNGRIGVVTGVNFFIFRHYANLVSPFLLDDYRLGLVVRGRMRGSINLKTLDMGEGTMAFVTPGTIVEPEYASDDFLLMGMGMSAEMFHLLHPNGLPKIFNGMMMDGQHTVEGEQRQILETLFQLLCRTAKTEGVDNGVVGGVVSAITSLFNQVFMSDESKDAVAGLRATEIFNNFLRLVNLHCRMERNMSFYAAQLCITERHLGAVVSQTSGVKAKAWIDRAVVTAAKVLLRHTDKQVSQIADELHFPNASFFCKYFHRLTGQTPQQYRTATNAE